VNPPDIDCPNHRISTETLSETAGCRPKSARI